jgi:hypothetical protein
MQLTRRSLFATLLSLLLARFRPKPKTELIGWDLGSESATAMWLGPDAGMVELPAPIEDLRVIRNELFVLTADGMYQVFGDGSYRRIDPPTMACVNASRPYPWQES